MPDRTPLPLILAFGICTASFAEDLAPRARFEHAVRPVLDSYCNDCHQGDDAPAGLRLARFTTGDGFQQHRRTWQKVVRRLRTGDMPPEDAEPLPEDGRAQLIAWLEAKLGEFDCTGLRDPGHVPLRRLNRTEYANTIRDLTGVQIEIESMLPRDELGYGFDNNASVLTLTPTLLEQYLSVAERIAAKAIIAPETLLAPISIIKRSDWDGGKEYGDEGRTLTSDGAIEFEHEFSAPGTYLLRTTLTGQQAGDELVQAALTSAGRQIHFAEVVATPDERQLVVVKLEVPAGKHSFGVEFLNDYYRPDHPNPNQRDRNLHVVELAIVGPLDEDPNALPASHRRLLSRLPTVEQWQDADAWRPLADELLRPLLLRAFRRPAQAAEIYRFTELIDTARRRGSSFARAMQLSLEAVLVSPSFLFVGDTDAAPNHPPGNEPLDEFHLAARLSYFLWNTMPDDELLAAASANSLRNNLASHVKRMLGDERSRSLARNFGSQWLGTRRLQDVHPDAQLFPEFDEALRAAMRTEAEMLLHHVQRHDLPITALLDADFTFVNRRLAEHYDLPAPASDDFTRTELPDRRRGGIVTLAGVLTVTSHPDRTSPVERGKWIMGQLLGEAPPPPPPGVDVLPEGDAAALTGTMRERMQRHREDPSCISCHQVMDPLGFALENYDAIGRWREQEGDQPIDNTGQLPDGRKFQGAAGLRELLLAEKATFRRTLIEKLLTYALGRGLEYYDQCAVDEIAAATGAGDDRFGAMVLAIISSEPFQLQRERAAGEE